MFRCDATGQIAHPRTSPVICYSYVEDCEHRQVVKKYDKETGEHTQIRTMGVGRQITGQMNVLSTEKALRVAEAMGFVPHGGTEAAVESIARSAELRRREEWGEVKGTMMQDEKAEKKKAKEALYVTLYSDEPAPSDGDS